MVVLQDDTQQIANDPDAVSVCRDVWLCCDNRGSNVLNSKTQLLCLKLMYDLCMSVNYCQAAACRLQ